MSVTCLLAVIAYPWCWEGCWYMPSARYQRLL